MSDTGNIVFFDLETTGLNTSVCDIIQLSAVCGKRVFNAHVLPTREITEGAKRVTGFTVRDGVLFRHGVPTSTVPLADALASFLDFLRSFGGPVRLAAHSARRFDAPVLTRVLRCFELLPQFHQVALCFLDTLLLAKSLEPGLDSYTQENLIHYFLRRSYDAHNAVADATMLQELFHHWNPSAQAAQRATFSTHFF
ncbi:DNA polymerase III subunit epsilon-like [Spinachia spinachia]